MSKFAGTWRLERYKYRRADGQMYFPLGEAPKGLLIYTADGHMSGQIMRPERANFVGGTLPSGTDAEIREAMLGYIAYFGEYTIDEREHTVTHKVLGSWHPNFVHSEQLRHYEFEGPDRLLLRTPPRKSGVEKRTGLLVWRRAV